MLCTGFDCNCPRCMGQNLELHAFELQGICRQTLEKYIYFQITPLIKKQMEAELNWAIIRYGKENDCHFPLFVAVQEPEDPTHLTFTPDWEQH